ncbi:formate dehydrogenase accessory sulfurtransferase FdhD [Thioclava litoralis]|uniref:Sulfur carrier protein FdhD n=1 Tax=Thioclava litoralis TaxID=3076557 RepID=A0ABZ1E474_9RHOB|nr:formate dehydrogenase accessory sulfurtransferase FdhD [Thioclava sp. FTW29]
MMQAVRRVGLMQGVSEPLIEEVPVALVYDGVTQAVMMATPVDLEDFLRGFALTEGIVPATETLSDIEILSRPRGLEVRAWLPTAASGAFRDRRRAMAGPVGCGLCGIDSLSQALREVPSRPLRPVMTLQAAAKALDVLREGQVLQDETRACHAAGLWKAGALVLLREDVGRHNAVDKLVGAALAAGHAPEGCAIVMTSRISVDLVQKAAMFGAAALVSPSAPTGLAVEEARRAGVQLIARARHAPEGRADYTAL